VQKKENFRLSGSLMILPC